MSVVYDAGALVAAERSERDLWADHRARLELGIVPVTTAPVVAQISRSGRQAQLRRFLRGCEVEPLRPEDAPDVSALAGGGADLTSSGSSLVREHRFDAWAVRTPEHLVRMTRRDWQPEHDAALRPDGC